MPDSDGAARLRVHVTVSVAGELDLATVADLEETVRSLPPAPLAAVEVDLARAAFVDVYAIRTLEVLARSIEDKGVEFSVSPAGPVFSRLLALLDDAGCPPKFRLSSSPRSAPTSSPPEAGLDRVR